jgi:hypothetical protein
MIWWRLAKMSTKSASCYKVKLKNNGKASKTEFLKPFLDNLFFVGTPKECKSLIHEDEDNTYISIDMLKNNDEYIFLRVGKQRDIEGALLRNVKTLESKEVIDKEEQGTFELEICTYFLLDCAKGVIISLNGLYAPTIKSFKKIVNEKSSKNFEIDYDLIFTKDSIKILEANGTRLNKIKYNYALPNVEMLENVGFTKSQVVALNFLGNVEVEVVIKNKGKRPITTKSDLVKEVLKSLYSLPKTIKDTLSVYGKTDNTSTKGYTFSEQELSYNIDIQTYKREEGIELKLTLEEIAEQVYNKLKSSYEENIKEIIDYIPKK